MQIQEENRAQIRMGTQKKTENMNFPQTISTSNQWSIYISQDFRQSCVKLNSNPKTKNWVMSRPSKLNVCGEVKWMNQNEKWQMGVVGL